MDSLSVASTQAAAKVDSGGGLPMRALQKAQKADAAVAEKLIESIDLKTYDRSGRYEPPREVGTRVNERA